MKLRSVSLLAASLALLGPAKAEACGGFFCSGQNIDQSGERVLFVLENGHVQAHIQIQFTGDADQFSWVVPVSTVPTFDVGSDEVFQALLGSTVPRYTRENRSFDSCNTSD